MENAHHKPNLARNQTRLTEPDEATEVILPPSEGAATKNANRGYDS
jgi:hypothetical protein